MPGPAAQSFWPANAIPNHFSLPAARASDVAAKFAATPNAATTAVAIAVFLVVVDNDPLSLITAFISYRANTFAFHT